MTHNELNVYLAAVLTTALEAEPSPFPESMAYLAMGCDLGKWEVVKSVLSQAGLATFAGNCVRLTAAGRDMARQCNAVIAG